MPAALDVDREAVKTLVRAVGCSEAARKTKIPLNTILSWSARGGWLVPAIPPPSMLQPVAIDAIKPSDAIANVIAENKLKTRTGLSKYAADAAKILSDSEGNLRNSRPAKDIADVMTKLWPEQSGSGNTINLALLCDQAQVQVVSEPKPQD